MGDEMFGNFYEGAMAFAFGRAMPPFGNHHPVS